MADFELERGSDARKVPVRLLFIQEDERPLVSGEDAEVCMSFPHLVIRELIAFLALTLVLVLISVFFNAPLEEMANPLLTPNPAKAPWYFLGLQELLHYYPPVVAGVILPGVVIVALMIVPYFEVNLQRDALWETGRTRKALVIAAAVLGVAGFFAVSGAHPVWPIIVPTLVIGVVVVLPGVLGTRLPGLRWLGSRSLAFWIFLWFLSVAATLTAIGVFFRGPGWSLILPWRDGMYY